MKKTILSTVAACAAVMTFAYENSAGAESGTLVVYFSATGTTKKAAEKIAAFTGGNVYGIRPVERYTSHDLDWTDRNSRSTVEMNDEKSRPEIVSDVVDMSSCDTVYLGYPIWWNLAPRVVNTFIESHDLKGKTAIPFATSGGSGIENSVKDLRRLYPDINWGEGRLLNGMSDSEIKKWLGL